MKLQHPKATRCLPRQYGGTLGVVLFFIASIALPLVLLFGLAIFGPPPYLLDRTALQPYANRAVAAESVEVETRVFATQEEARAAAKRYVERVAPSRSKTLDEYRFNHDGGEHEMVTSIDGVLLRIKGSNRERVDAAMAKLPFITPNPEPNILWVVFQNHIGYLLVGLFAYVILITVIVSHWMSAAATVRPSENTLTVSVEALENALRQLDTLPSPVSITEQGPHRFRVEWRIADAHWSNLLQTGGLNKRMTLHLRLSPNANTVRAVLTTSTLHWKQGVLPSIGWAASRSIAGF
ncbi:MAG: hypothetical protein AAF420_05320, partial [Pseudomonadota bacterium]